LAGARRQGLVTSATGFLQESEGWPEPEVGSPRHSYRRAAALRQERVELVMGQSVDHFGALVEQVQKLLAQPVQALVHHGTISQA